MKKTLFIFSAALLLMAVACGASSRDSEEVISFDQLPSPARTFIETNFSGSQPSVIIKDVDGRKVEYEVKFSDGREVDFNKEGEWKDVDCERQEVPSAIVPAQIASEAAAKFPDAKIVKIKKEKTHWEIELSNDVEIEFNPDYSVRKVDL